MRRGWGRWRGYMDELEVVMRQAAERLAEAEALIAEAWERSTWHRPQKESVDREILRRAQDMPFLGRLLGAARRLDEDERLEPPDFIGHAWEEGEEGSALDSPHALSASKRPARGCTGFGRGAPRAFARRRAGLGRAQPFPGGAAR